MHDKQGPEIRKALEVFIAYVRQDIVAVYGCGFEFLLKIFSNRLDEDKP